MAKHMSQSIKRFLNSNFVLIKLKNDLGRLLIIQEFHI